jgi:hypothetical protein
VRTYNGGFRSTFPVKTDDQNPKKRFTVTLGNGSAHLELESFGGTIALRRPGEPRPETERKRRDRDRDKGAGAAVDDAIQNAMAALDSVQPGVDRAVSEALREVQPEIGHALTDAMRDAQHAIDRALDEVFGGPGRPHPTPRPTPQPRRR